MLKLPRKPFSAILLAFLSGLFFLSCKSAPKKLSDLNNINIVLIAVDTLAANQLGAYTPDLRNSPNIDKILKNGVWFKQAFSSAPWTKPSFASVFTGMMPSSHELKGITSKLKPEITTLSEVLKSRGYQTTGIISHTLITGNHGFSQGFDSYKLVKFKGNVHDSVTSNQVSDMALKWLSHKTSDKKNFFLFLHYFDPHFNYQHHQQFDRTSNYKGPITPGIGIQALRRLIPSFTKEDPEYLKDLYREEISFTDLHIGRVVDFIENSELKDNTLIVFTADHGEEFMEHGYIGHTRTLFDELIHVPLAFYLPALIKPRTIDTPVSLIDIFPTILSLGKNPGVSPPSEGISLLPTLETGEPPPDLDIYSEVSFRSSKDIKESYKIAVIRGPMKLVLDRTTGSYSLYNRSVDPEELTDLSSKEPEMGKILTELISEFDKKHLSSPAPAPLDNSPVPEEVEQLKSLGYM